MNIKELYKTKDWIYCDYISQLEGEIIQIIVENNFKPSPYNKINSISFYSECQTYRISDHWQKYPQLEFDTNYIYLVDTDNMKILKKWNKKYFKRGIHRSPIETKKYRNVCSEQNLFY